MIIDLLMYLCVIRMFKNSEVLDDMQMNSINLYPLLLRYDKLFIIKGRNSHKWFRKKVKIINNLEEMDKFLEIQPTMNHEEIENLDRPVTNKETKSEIRNLPQAKVRDQMASLPRGMLCVMWRAIMW